MCSPWCERSIALNSDDLWKLAEASSDDLIGFAQRLVKTPSLSGQEGEVAALVEAEMRRLGYDRVWVDDVGNVVGVVGASPAPGRGERRPALMLNGHMDHVDAGDPAHWAHLPFAGEIHDGALWGRGAVDMKGALAAMVYAGGLVKRLGVALACDLVVSATVQEEVGGLGARHLSRTLPVDRVIIGEASGNDLRRGHRGRVELRATFAGRSVHASMPHLGVNPHYSMARFVSGLSGLEMARDPVYGTSTVAPTRVTSRPESANVTPSDLRLALDWRNVPGESVVDILSKLQDLTARTLDPGCQGRIEVGTKELTTYTGRRMSYPDEFPSFTTPADDPWLAELQAALQAVLRREVGIDIWRFATDYGHFASAGARVLGFGPGDATVVHTVEERLPVKQLAEGVVGYTAICLAPRSATIDTLPG
jgi:succinyl-diaminopimelate desuccinylase